MKLKKIISLFLLLALLVPQCACGNTNVTEPSETSHISSQSEVAVPQSTPTADAPAVTETPAAVPSPSNVPEEEELPPSPEPTPPEAPAVTPPPHRHAYATTVVEPTRNSEGYMLHTCDCGDSYKDAHTEKLPAEGKWSQADLDAAEKLGVLPSGFAAGPAEDVTVGEVIAAAVRVHSVSHNKTLPVENETSNAQGYVAYAIENGIINNTDFTELNRAATRRETAYIFSRAVPAESLAEKNTIAFSAIPDVTVVDRFGEEIYTLYRAGITVGSDAAGTYHPDATLSRGWTAAMAVRLLNPSARETITLAEAPDLPDTFKRGEERGVTTIYCAYSPICNKYTSVPLASGLPKLTNEEIDWLIATEDYALIADSITTWADCANYFLRAGFEEKASGYGRFWSTHICGQQVMARRGGGCGGMSNAAAYILRGDYEELGYIHIDHHIQLYLLIDGLYYVMDPAHYHLAEGAHFVPGWFYGCASGATICADNLQEIADGWVASGVVTEHFYTFVSPGDVFPYSTWVPENLGIWAFPIGTHVNVWFGPDVIYSDPEPKFQQERPDGKFEFIPIPVIDWTTGTDWVDESLITRE